MESFSLVVGGAAVVAVVGWLLAAWWLTGLAIAGVTVWLIWNA